MLPSLAPTTTQPEVKIDPLDIRLERPRRYLVTPGEYVRDREKLKSFTDNYGPILDRHRSTLLAIGDWPVDLDYLGFPFSQDPGLTMQFARTHGPFLLGVAEHRRERTIEWMEKNGAFAQELLDAFGNRADLTQGKQLRAFMEIGFAVSGYLDDAVKRNLPAFARGLGLFNFRDFLKLLHHSILSESPHKWFEIARSYGDDFRRAYEIYGPELIELDRSELDLKSFVRMLRNLPPVQVTLNLTKSDTVRKVLPRLKELSEAYGPDVAGALFACLQPVGALDLSPATDRFITRLRQTLEKSDQLHQLEKTACWIPWNRLTTQWQSTLITLAEIPGIDLRAAISAIHACRNADVPWTWIRRIATAVRSHAEPVLSMIANWPKDQKRDLMLFAVEAIGSSCWTARAVNLLSTFDQEAIIRIPGALKRDRLLFTSLIARFGTRSFSALASFRRLPKDLRTALGSGAAELVEILPKENWGSPVVAQFIRKYGRSAPREISLRIGASPLREDPERDADRLIYRTLFGISEYYRYAEVQKDGSLDYPLLEGSVTNLNPLHRSSDPCAFIVAARGDWNRALTRIPRVEVGQLPRTHKVFCFEVGSIGELLLVAEKIGSILRSFGRSEDPRTTTVFVGHMSGLFVDLDYKADDPFCTGPESERFNTAYFEHSDRSELRQLLRHLPERSRFIMTGCNAAQGGPNATNLFSAVAEEGPSLMVYACRDTVCGTFEIEERNQKIVLNETLSQKRWVFRSESTDSLPVAPIPAPTAPRE